jgi:hypothetical protein
VTLTAVEWFSRGCKRSNDRLDCPTTTTDGSVLRCGRKERELKRCGCGSWAGFMRSGEAVSTSAVLSLWPRAKLKLELLTP